MLLFGFQGQLEVEGACLSVVFQRGNAIHEGWHILQKF